jgi:hypothetical protein
MDVVIEKLLPQSCDDCIRNYIKILVNEYLLMRNEETINDIHDYLMSLFPIDREYIIYVLSEYESSLERERSSIKTCPHYDICFDSNLTKNIIFHGVEEEVELKPSMTKKEKRSILNKYFHETPITKSHTEIYYSKEVKPRFLNNQIIYPKDLKK